MTEREIDKYEHEITAPTERIKQLLKERGITQQDIADKFGKSLINIKKTLNGNSMTTSNLKRYADLLGVPIWELFISREEVLNENKDLTTGVCPHCGKPITIETTIKKNGEK